jgi:hypothetical protein
MRLGIGSLIIMARKEQGGTKKTLCVIRNDSETDMKSVSRIRLVKSESNIVCVTVNCNEYRSEIALYCL